MQQTPRMTWEFAVDALSPPPLVIYVSVFLLPLAPDIFTILCFGGKVLFIEFSSKNKVTRYECM